jgi:hypothetical protein
VPTSSILLKQFGVRPGANKNTQAMFDTVHQLMVFTALVNQTVVFLVVCVFKSAPL